MSKKNVKDRVIRYLTEELLVPVDMIDTEVPVSEFEEGSEGTIDILVNVKDEQDFFVPVLLVHCVDEDIKLEGETIQELTDLLEEYANVTLVERLVLTNGDEMMFLDLGTAEDEEMPTTLPTYEEMIREFKETEAMFAEHEEEHHHGHECGCGHNHDEEHECCGGSCGCGHDHE